MLYLSAPFLLLVGSPVMIEQIPANLPLRSRAEAPRKDIGPLPTVSNEGGVPGVRRTSDGRIAVSRAIVEACRRDPAAQSLPQELDCRRILELVDFEARRTAEGTLLGLLNDRPNVAQRGTPRAVSSADADAVAREVSSGAASGNAAAVAARQRVQPSAGPR